MVHLLGMQARGPLLTDDKTSNHCQVIGAFPHLLVCLLIHSLNEYLSSASCVLCTMRALLVGIRHHQFLTPRTVCAPGETRPFSALLFLNGVIETDCLPFAYIITGQDSQPWLLSLSGHSMHCTTSGGVLPWKFCTGAQLRCH